MLDRLFLAARTVPNFLGKIIPNPNSGNGISVVS